MKWPVKWPIFKYYKTNKNSGIVSLIAFQNGITFENRTILGYLAIQNVSRGSIQGLEVWHLNFFFSEEILIFDSKDLLFHGLPSKNASKYPEKCN